MSFGGNNKRMGREQKGKCSLEGRKMEKRATFTQKGENKLG
jgi:hypothetical protein